ncbi:MAG: hypothetical protein DMG56_18830, partial [Acidobacteria bacterium]
AIFRAEHRAGESFEGPYRRVKKGHLDVLALPEFFATKAGCASEKPARPSAAWQPRSAKSGMARALGCTSGTPRAPQETIVAELRPARNSALAIRVPPLPWR